MGAGLHNHILAGWRLQIKLGLAPKIMGKFSWRGNFQTSEVLIRYLLPTTIKIERLGNAEINILKLILNRNCFGENGWWRGFAGYHIKM
jgi:hypothetical protein